MGGSPTLHGWRRQRNYEQATSKAGCARSPQTHGTAQYTVKDAGDATVACFTSAFHTAFLPLAHGQVVATISPPLFVWADARYLTGALCVLATAYNEDAQSCITKVDTVQA